MPAAVMLTRMRQNIRMSSIRTLFSGDYIERAAELRVDEQALHAALTDSATRFIAVWEEHCLINEAGPVMLSGQQLGDFSVTRDSVIFLGRRDERFLFSIALHNDVEPDLPVDGSFSSLRDLSNRLEPDALGLIAYARAMVIWQQRHRYCGICGGANRAMEGGFVLSCTNDDCAHRVFPRLDPAIIVLVHDGEHCLLGRQALWPENRFSTIAGFVEPGESLEDAVRREVYEETNILVGDVRYHSSQPWPFPSSLMLGFIAGAVSEEISLNDGELEHASWFSREELTKGDVGLPHRISIARRLVDHFIASD
jgi:NAD+ diphosphatase